MKRVKRISASSSHGEFDITITFRHTAGLISSEVDRVVTHLADEAMKAIASAPYARIPLSSITVK